MRADYRQDPEYQAAYSLYANAHTAEQWNRANHNLDLINRRRSWEGLPPIPYPQMPPLRGMDWFINTLGVLFAYALGLALLVLGAVTVWLFFEALVLEGLLGLD